MRTERKEMVEVTIITWACDFCDFKTENNKGCCGSAPVMSCSICSKHMCRDHRQYFQEDHSSDYPDAVVCLECAPKFSEAWEWAEENAGRHDDIFDVAMERLKSI